MSELGEEQKGKLACRSFKPPNSTSSICAAHAVQGTKSRDNTLQGPWPCRIQDELKLPVMGFKSFWKNAHNFHSFGEGALRMEPCDAWT